MGGAISFGHDPQMPIILLDILHHHRLGARIIDFTASVNITFLHALATNNCPIGASTWTIAKQVLMSNTIFSAHKFLNFGSYNLTQADSLPQKHAVSEMSNHVFHHIPVHFLHFNRLIQPLSHQRQSNRLLR
jgi:hypothetical protein